MEATEMERGFPKGRRIYDITAGEGMQTRQKLSRQTKAFCTQRKKVVSKCFKTVKNLANRTQNTLNMYVFLI